MSEEIELNDEPLLNWLVKKALEKEGEKDGRKRL